MSILLNKQRIIFHNLFLIIDSDSKLIIQHNSTKVNHIKQKNKIILRLALFFHLCYTEYNLMVRENYAQTE